MKYEALTHKIIGCAMEVHKHLGNGFQKVVYRRALSSELLLQQVDHTGEMERPLERGSFGSEAIPQAYTDLHTNSIMYRETLRRAVFSESAAGA
jgi:GxxExxY protein